MLAAELPPELATAPLLGRLGEQLIGTTGAQVASILREARTRAPRARSNLGEAYLTTAAGAVARPLDPDLLFRAAIHESDHLLIGHLAGLPAAHTARLTATGGEVSHPMPRVLTPDTVDALIRMHLAGRAAERVALGDVSNGAGGGPRSDLALATDLAVRAQVDYGLGHDLVWQPPDTAARLMPERLRRVVHDRLRRTEEEGRADLEKHRANLARIARELMEKREIDAESLRALFAPIPSPDITPHAEDHHRRRPYDIAPATRCAMWRLRASEVIWNPPNLTPTRAKIPRSKSVRQRHDTSGTFLDEAIRLLTLFVARHAIALLAPARPCWP